MDSINKRIKEIRQNLHMSQEEFGRAIGLSKSGISNIENGNRGVRDAHIKLICTTFNISENWLRTGNTLAAQVRTLQVFDDFLESLGYIVDMDGIVLNSHTEDITDENNQVIGHSEIADEVDPIYHITKNGITTTFSSSEWNNFQKEIENSIDFQIWKKQRNL